MKTIERVELLNQNLADEYVIYATTYDYYWNVTGPDFIALNRVLEELYEASQQRLYAIAERSGAVPLWAKGNLVAPQNAARLFSRPGMGMPAEVMIAEIIALHRNAARQINADIAICDRLPDPGTAAFLRQIRDAHKQTASTLGAMSQSPHNLSGNAAMA